MSDIYTMPIFAKMTDREKEIFEERAAIREYEGEEERWKAENAALRDILMLRGIYV